MSKDRFFSGGGQSEIDALKSDLEFILPSPYYVDISGATESAKYHCEHDGYILMEGAASGKTYLNLHTPFLAYMTTNDTGSYHTIFVKKGMNLWFRVDATYSVPTFARYFPIKP